MIVACLFPRFVSKVIQKFYFPYDSDIIREQVRLHMFDEKQAARNLRELIFTPHLSLHHRNERGFYHQIHRDQQFPDVHQVQRNLRELRK